MKTKQAYAVLGTAAVIVAIFLMLGPLYIVNEGSQAVVTRFGEIVDTHTEAGLYVKVPFIDVVTVYPKLILSLDGDAYRIPTKENQFIIVDTTSRWRITDPKKFYQSLKTLNAAYNRLSDVIDSATRTVITQNPLSEVVRTSNQINDKIRTGLTETTDTELNVSEVQIETLVNANTLVEQVSKGRRQLSLEMAAEARKTVGEYGIELIDIVPRQIKYSDEMTDSVYNRMITDRKQVAQAYRSWGEGQKADVLGKLEKDKKSIESEAYRRAQEIKGNADAQAAQIYAQAYAKDPEFYAFWKSMESYKTTVPGFDAAFSTNMDYFKYLYAPSGR
ncbi:protease modulator HflC [Treponema sp. HNW]|uniref:protease modulator HflC n=1 Tax=Treponema sp. HNW TaxID=3116654 RepID=UPI003D14F2EE